MDHVARARRRQKWELGGVLKPAKTRGSRPASAVSPHRGWGKTRVDPWLCSRLRCGTKGLKRPTDPVWQRMHSVHPPMYGAVPLTPTLCRAPLLPGLSHGTVSGGAGSCRSSAARSVSRLPGRSYWSKLRKFLRHLSSHVKRTILNPVQPMRS